MNLYGWHRERISRSSGEFCLDMYCAGRTFLRPALSLNLKRGLNTFSNIWDRIIVSHILGAIVGAANMMPYRLRRSNMLQLSTSDYLSCELSESSRSVSVQRKARDRSVNHSVKLVSNVNTHRWHVLAVEYFCAWFHVYQLETLNDMLEGNDGDEAVLMIMNVR